MQQYIIRRILLNFVVLFFVATLVFLILRFDFIVGRGDDSTVIQNIPCNAGTSQEALDECKQIARSQLGLDCFVDVLGGNLPVLKTIPCPKDYFNYIVDTAQFDFGSSFKSQNAVIDELGERVEPTIELGLLQILVAVIIALPIGIVSAVRQDTWIDYFLRFFSIAFLGIPVFVVAIIVIMLTSRYAGSTVLPDWFGPHQGYVSFWDDPQQNFMIMFAPALIGGLATGAVIMRFLRSQMLEVLRQDYVRTAWSKGLKERVVIVRHALKNALIPVLTLIGILLGSIVSANIVLEQIYTIPGIGNYVVFAVAQNPDFPVIQGIVILVALVLVFINLLVDLAYGWLDPRIRYS